MTILVNELRIRNSFTDVTLIQVADRRITLDGKFHSNQKKIFQISYLKSSVGYFGLSQPTSKQFFSSWLPNIIRHGHEITTIKEFAQYLTDKLNKDVSKSFLRNTPSGFHLCGLANDGIPEFYFIRNIDSMNGIYYKGFRDYYYFSEDFRTRDAITTNEGRKRALSSLQNCTFWYVNGDLRSFWAFWMLATQFIDSISLSPEFPALKTDLERAKWKLEGIAQLYEKYAKQKIVGGPIDGIEIRP